MSKIGQEAEAILKQLIELVVPAGMTPAERRHLALKSGISEETLRTTLKRKSMNADTLLRLLLARGVSAKTLVQLPQTELAKLPKGEAEWLSLGRDLSEEERVEFVGLVKYLRARWKLAKEK